MRKNIIKLFLLLLFFQISCYIIYNKEKVDINKISNKIKVNYIDKINEKINNNDDSIGNIKIEKLGINNRLYDLNNEKNNVDQNVTILEGSIEPDKNNSIMFIAAHSGTGEIAYFKDLDKLNKNDEVILDYKGNEYKYKVVEKWETNKDGDIEVTKTDENQLVLTTCSPSNETKQLIVNCILKES